MLNYILMLGLTAFVSVNGQLYQVPRDSEVYSQYRSGAEITVEDIELLSEVVEPTAEPTTEPTAEPTAESTAEPTTEPTAEPTASPTPEPSVVVVDNEEEVALLSDMVDLLAENSDTATGTLNSSVLALMDRMIDAYPTFYKYAGFRTSEDDSYQSTLYISKDMEVEGDTITFGSDCTAVTFARQTTSSGYSGYIYYNISESPHASVNVNSGTIVYTNCLKGYPTLGTKSFFSEHWIWVAVFVLLASLLFNRRTSHD